MPTLPSTSSYFDPSAPPLPRLKTSSKRFPFVPLDGSHLYDASLPNLAPSMADLARSRALNRMSDISGHSSFSIRPHNRYQDRCWSHRAVEDPGDSEKDVESRDVSVIPSSLASASSGSSNDPPPPSKSEMSQYRQLAFILIVCSAQFLSLGGMNQTVAPVMILADYFQIHDYGTLSWFSAAYSMTVGTFILPAGRLGDMYGHKRIFLIGWAWFSIWSLVSGFCYRWGVVVFSICRAFQGIGPALVVPNAIALIGRNFPIGVKRNTVFACFGASGPTGATAGAVFSALIAELYWWPWCFWVLCVVALCVMAMAYLIIPDEEGPLHPLGIDPPSFDYLGCLTGVTGLVLINFALNQAPLAGWAKPYIPAILAVGVLIMAVFVWVELYITSHPLIPIRGLGYEALFALACIAAGWGSHGIWAYYLYLFLEHLRGHSALLTAAETSPVAITGVFFAFSTVWLLRRVAVSWVMLIAMLFFLIGALLMALAPLHQTYWAQTFLSVLLMPGAMNLSFPAATILLSSALPKDKQGIAASLVSTMVNYSISCGLGFAGSIHRYTIDRASKQLGIDKLAPLGNATPDVVQSRLTGLRGAYWFAVGLSGLGVLIAGVFIIVTKWKQRPVPEQIPSPEPVEAMSGVTGPR